LANNRQGRIEYFEDSWRYITPRARWLVEEMTNPKAEDRLTAAEALAHPWFIDTISPPSPLRSTLCIPPLAIAAELLVEGSEDTKHEKDTSCPPISGDAKEERSCSALARNPMSLSVANTVVSPISIPLPSLPLRSLASPSESQTKSPCLAFEQLSLPMACDQVAAGSL
jgi:hypothetical protein